MARIHVFAFNVGKYAFRFKPRVPEFLIRTLIVQGAVIGVTTEPCLGGCTLCSVAVDHADPGRLFYGVLARCERQKSL